jgi:hypothetical protein
MKVEILYVPDCPSHPAAVKLIKNVLAAHGITVHVHEVLVTDERTARELKFLGSPTIRINGRDVTGSPEAAGVFALSCRLYPGSVQIGLPPTEMVNRAVQEARQGEQQ